MLILYNLISTLGMFLYIPRLVTRRGPEDRTAYIKERLGASSYDRTDIWVHAVSVGETLAALPFLKKLKREFPGKSLTLSTTTYTGQKVAREKFPQVNRIMYMPLDSPLCVKRAAENLRPALFITVETEIWPALFHALKEAGSRIIILNGRISGRSFRRYRRVRPFIKKVLSAVDFLYMQDRVYADRILELGADRHKVGVMGNFKFDIEVDAAEDLPWLDRVQGKIFLAASTHKGEEEIILQAYELVRNSNKDVKLILAPRHPERFDEAAGLMEKKHLTYVRRTALDRDGASPDIILLDTIGELSRLFSRAAVAFIGGSLVPTGGHNILEPAYWSKPILFGPHMDNFPIAEEFLEKSAAQEVRDSRDMAELVLELLENKDRAARMGINARAIVDRNTGAVNRALALIRGYLGTD
ncbi:MAG: 3-deoxy-D-manno-octulosonic acid transferase [Nitrospiraceae bacterium]|nr:MAG: 3-deoxy-D-manno-octulosonic acid transferase [Nitrospiraceae bacterium]